MRTAAGQCCFYTMPEVDAEGRARHAAIRTYEDLCDGWMILHKARPANYIGRQSCFEKKPADVADQPTNAASTTVLNG